VETPPPSADKNSKETVAFIILKYT